MEVTLKITNIYIELWMCDKSVWAKIEDSDWTNEWGFIEAGGANVRGRYKPIGLEMIVGEISRRNWKAGKWVSM